MIGPEEQALICDFGCARLEIATQAWAGRETSSLKGTTNYWAPELLLFNEDLLESDVPVARKESDVWAFGMTIYVCCSFSNHLLL